MLESKLEAILEDLSFKDLKNLLKDIISERNELLAENESLKKQVGRFTTADLTLDEMEEQYKNYYSQV